ncbi:MAG: DUF5320 domain-containing protein [Candidatus Brocadiaceae bacterium]|nr:DUF5320 domain-containing protein [Candidatus Brocadiaceae bacterium]
MPGGDGSGPMGMGPMTGRAAGFCAGYSVPGYMNADGRGGWGRGMGWGRGRGGWGRGMGWGRGFWGAGYAPAAPVWGAPAYGYAAPSRESQAAMLKDQATALEQQLEEIRAQIEELQKEQGR